MHAGSGDATFMSGCSWEHPDLKKKKIYIYIYIIIIFFLFVYPLKKIKNSLSQNQEHPKIFLKKNLLQANPPGKKKAHYTENRNPRIFQKKTDWCRPSKPIHSSTHPSNTNKKPHSSLSNSKSPMKKIILINKQKSKTNLLLHLLGV